MARGEDEKHWLLKRQLHEHSEDSIPKSLLQAVNRAYRVFDDNYLRIKLILRRKIYQLVESNAKLQELLQEREQQLDTDREHLKFLVENLNRAEVIAQLGSFTWYMGTGRIEYSENFSQLLKLKKTDRSALSLFRRFEVPHTIIAALQQATALNNVIRLENLKLKNEPRYFDMEAHVTFEGEARMVLISGIVKENTRLVHSNNRAEDQKQFYEAILNNIPVDIAIFNQEHKYMYLNPVAVGNQEVRDFLLGRDDFDYCSFRNIQTTKAQERRDMFLKARNSKQTVEFEDVNANADGTLKYVSRRLVPVLNADGDFAFMLGYGVDITPIKEHELMLGNSLHEKELLLGEIHHSVKNNLTLIVALLEINSAHEKDELVKKYFNEIRNRISAMALIYDKLYRSAVFNRINLNEYITALVQSLQQTLLAGRRDVVELDVDEIYVENKIAVPLALLINELVSNAFIHAFNSTSFPRLQLSFKRESDAVIRLIVSDNGPGLPEDFDIAKGKTFGFKLIGLFARQLKGKLSMENNSGLSVHVEFQNMVHEVRN
jgi:two-component sensor histidine kinase/PAS domain-containing protein